MNRLIIIGNGFDLAHGMRTRFSDFIVGLLKQEVTNVNTKILSSRPDFQDSQFFDFRVANHALHRKTDFRGELSKPTEWKELIGLIEHFLGKVAPKTDFISAIWGDIEYQGWSDIEAVYFHQLMAIVKKRKKSILSEIDKNMIQNLNAEMELLRASLIKYLKLENDKIKSLSIPDTKSNFFWDTMRESANYRGAKYPQRFKTAHQTPSKVMLVNFNYTSTLDIYSKSNNSYQQGMDRNPIITHIHGHLNNPDDVIFGYGDETNDYYKELEDLDFHPALDYIKSFGYFNHDNYNKLIDFINQDMFQVYLIGHSCGLSDRIMLKTIFNHDKCEFIRLFYHQRENDNNYKELTQSISRHFLNKEKQRERIIIQPSCEAISNLGLVKLES